MNFFFIIGKVPKVIVRKIIIGSTTAYRQGGFLLNSPVCVKYIEFIAAQRKTNYLSANLA